jgi:hypothetical protein
LFDQLEVALPVDGRYWMRLEWRALARALRESGEARALAVRDAMAFRQARHTRFPDMIDSERALDINEGFASYTGTVLAAPSGVDAIASALDGLAAAEDGESFVRTFAYASGQRPRARFLYGGVFHDRRGFCQLSPELFSFVSVRFRRISALASAMRLDECAAIEWLHVWLVGRPSFF